MPILEIIVTEKPTKEFPPYALVFGTLERKHQIMFYVTKESGYYASFETKEITPEFYDHYEHKIVVGENIHDIYGTADVVRTTVVGKRNDYRRRYDLKEWIIEALRNLQEVGLISEEELKKSRAHLKKYKIIEPNEDDSIIYPLIAVGTLFGITGILWALACIIIL